MDPILQHLWQHLTERLEKILSVEALPEYTVMWVREMLDHNELGLAWDALHEHEEGFSPGSLNEMRKTAIEMGREPEGEHALHERALASSDGPDALALWIELASRGNPDAPDRLRAYARCDDLELREPARAALGEMELSHDDPMP